MEHHRIDIAKTINRGNTHHFHSLRRQPRVPRPVTLRPIATVMRLAVDFDREPSVRAGEIQHIGARRMLPPKSQPIRS